jgi:5-methylcytosine-specific restriction endonuclease McrA
MLDRGAPSISQRDGEAAPAWRRRRSIIRRKLARRQDALCAICGLYMRTCDRTFDHIVPRCKDGPDTIDNLRLAHAACNQARGCDDE